MDFEILHYNSRLLRDALEVISRTTDELYLRVGVESLEVRQMDPTHTTLIELFLPNVEFLEYRLRGDGEELLLVNLEHLMKALNRCRGTERVGLKTEEKKLVVQYPDSKRAFWIPIERRKRDEPPQPKLDLGARLVLVDPGELIDILKDIESSDFDVVGLKAEGDRVEITSAGDGTADVRYCKVFERDDSGVGLTCNDGGQESYYKISALKNLLTTKLGSVTLEWGNRIPIRITYEVGRGALRFTLAPYIMEE